MIIGIVGHIGSGKDTVGNIITQHTQGRRDSFAAPLKDLCASIFGWERHLLEGDTIEMKTPVNYLRLNIHTDGGISRFRVFGKLMKGGDS